MIAVVCGGEMTSEIVPMKFDKFDWIWITITIIGLAGFAVAFDAFG